jgi:hypothetical protein
MEREMKKLMIAAGAAALLAASSLAAFADSASGTIQAVDPAAMTVTLDDGNTYKLPAGFDAASLKVGGKVNIEFSKDAGGANAASAVTPAT